MRAQFWKQARAIACPVSAHGIGGRAANSTDCGRNLDSFTIERTFPDGVKAFDVLRWLANCHTEFATYLHVTKRAALSNLADIIGRAAAHCGKVITWDEAMASDFQFCPNIDRLTDDSAAPVQADAQGRYPAPIPGQWTEI